MRKLKVFSILLLLFSTAAFVLFQMYARVVQDNTPPVVTCDTDEITVSIAAAEEELLQGVTAQDQRSGDVTDTVVIESLSAFTDEGTRIITYAALDDSMNVGRCERTLKYEDYEPPVFHMSAPLCFTEGGTVNILSCVSAESTLDGSLTSNIKYALEKTVNTTIPGNYPVEFRVTDSGGKTVYLKTDIEICEREYAGIKVELEQYLVHVKKNADFNAESYFKTSDREGELEIESNVDTSKEGVYTVDYIVEDTNLCGKSRLVVVVE